MVDLRHLRSDWCPVEGRLSDGPGQDGTCGVCGDPIELSAVQNAPGATDTVPMRSPASSISAVLGYSPHAKAAERLRWPFTIMVALLGIQIVLSTLELWILAEWAVRDSYAVTALASTEGYASLAFVASAVTFVVWSFLAHSNLDVFGRTDQTHAHRAAIWWWFAPLANLVMPYRVMYETVRGSEAPQGDASWKANPLPRSAAWWTGLFITALLLDQVLWQFFEDALLSYDFDTFRLVAAGTEIVWIAAAATTIVMMRRVNRAQSRLAAHWRGPALYPFGGPSLDRRPSRFLGPIDTELGSEGDSQII